MDQPGFMVKSLNGHFQIFGRIMYDYRTLPECNLTGLRVTLGGPTFDDAFHSTESQMTFT